MPDPGRVNFGSVNGGSLKLDGSIPSSKKINANSVFGDGLYPDCYDVAVTNGDKGLMVACSSLFWTMFSQEYPDLSDTITFKMNIEDKKHMQGPAEHETELPSSHGEKKKSELFTEEELGKVIVNPTEINVGPQYLITGHCEPWLIATNSIPTISGDSTNCAYIDFGIFR